MWNFARSPLECGPYPDRFCRMFVVPRLRGSFALPGFAPLLYTSAMHRASLAVAAFAAFLSFSAAEPPPARPNLLIVIADNWGVHAGAYGTKAVKTPHFDRLAAEGVLFQNAFCPVPSCTPTRSAILTGQAAHRLEDAANLWSRLWKKFPVYPELLEHSGYSIGYTGKGWGPGPDEAGGRTRHPFGEKFKDLAAFLDQVPEGRPFHFWLGDISTGRQKIRALTDQPLPIDPADVDVPPEFPDVPEIRKDIAAYYTAVGKYDDALGDALRLLEARGLIANTIVVAASDNGWQFPRGLANCYDSGCHVPLAIRWCSGAPDAGRIAPAGTRAEPFVELADLAPSLLEIAGAPIPATMTARSLLPILRGDPAPDRDAAFLERERHANVRRGDLGFPCRAIRTRDFLYIRNLRPDRWPAGDPEFYWSVGPFGDIDDSPTKRWMMEHRDDPAHCDLIALSLGKRPAEELYDLKSDPAQVRNLAADPACANVKQRLAARLDQWMRDTADPRVDTATDVFDTYPYYSPKLKYP